ncbi:peptidylprolyl isomerase [Rhodoferax sp.]|uniref:peptidylprolyl isomerase n=1 Tax=Rhodoferax sp. TaxID=50421 RepID=UPI00262BDEAD|nr:peptidylprolyl isomerase [Rhodoferax sp.]MDD2809010.1 peptidylprolyl isomerase [Rhodoferax sp.]
MNYKSFTALARTAVACVALYSVACLTQAEVVRQVKLATSQGDIVLELYPEKAPKTVENFVQYVKDKHYDGTIFHRVIGSFMIQGGGFDANYVQKPTRAPVVHEGRAAMEKGLHNVAGTVAMARTSDPQSASAQFFINVADNRRLDPTFIPPGDPVPEFEFNGEVFKNMPRAELLNARKLFGYTVFGKVISGMDVVDKIKATPTGAGGPFGTDVPKTPILINSATLVK